MTTSPPAWLRDTPLAHRGLHGVCVPENSLEAFAMARDAGVGVELDVQLSSDGIPVVFHDHDLWRMTAVHGPVADRSVEQLASLRLDQGDESIPTLAQVLEVLGSTPTMVEVKNNHPRGGILEAAVGRSLEMHVARGHDAICAASFNPWSLRWLRHSRPDIVRVLTAGPLDDIDLPAGARWTIRNLRHLASVAPAAVAYDQAGLDVAAVQRYRERGGTVVAWTITNGRELARAHTLADNLIFEGLSIAEVTGSSVWPASSA